MRHNDIGQNNVFTLKYKFKIKNTNWNKFCILFYTVGRSPHRFRPFRGHNKEKSVTLQVKYLEIRKKQTVLKTTQTRTLLVY